jgi:hypothetical protein
MADEWSEEALARAQDRADRVSEAIDCVPEARLRAVAQAARGSSTKLVWLQRVADVVVSAAEATGRKRQAQPEGAQTLLEHLRESEQKGASELRRRVDDAWPVAHAPFSGMTNDAVCTR